MSITRRLFLRNTAAAGALGATVAAPAVVEATPAQTPLDQALWHIRELERLLIEGGGDRPVVIVQAEFGADVRSMGINIFGRLTVDDDMFTRGDRT